MPPAAVKSLEAHAAQEGMKRRTLQQTLVRSRRCGRNWMWPLLLPLRSWSWAMRLVTHRYGCCLLSAKVAAYCISSLSLKRITHHILQKYFST